MSEADVASSFPKIFAAAMRAARIGDRLAPLPGPAGGNNCDDDGSCATCDRNEVMLASRSMLSSLDDKLYRRLDRPSGLLLLPSACLYLSDGNKLVVLTSSSHFR